jgi:hypothetical protein
LFLIYTLWLHHMLKTKLDSICCCRII